MQIKQLLKRCKKDFAQVAQISPSSTYRFNSYNTVVNCDRARIDNRTRDARANGKQICKIRCPACLRPLKHSMLSSTKGEKGQPRYKGLGETGFVATVNTCQEVVLFETRSAQPSRNLQEWDGRREWQN